MTDREWKKVFTARAVAAMRRVRSMPAVQLAAGAGISLRHLVMIEDAQVLPRPATIRRLETAMRPWPVSRSILETEARIMTWAAFTGKEAA